MPVQKFRDFDEARKALWADSGQIDLVPRIKRLWAFSTRLTPPQIPRGIRKFRSIEEANQDRDNWVRRRVSALRAKRT
jgi:hypothetical protein